MQRTCEGGCQCGAVRYVIEGEPKLCYACHCTQCQRQSGSAFGMALLFGHWQIRMTGVEPAFYVRDGVGGRRARCAFCPECGSRIYHLWAVASADAQYFNLKPGTLDDYGWVRPDFHIWAQNRQSWTRFGPDEVVFEQRMPPELAQQLMSGTL